MSEEEVSKPSGQRLHLHGPLMSQASYMGPLPSQCPGLHLDNRGPAFIF